MATGESEFGGVGGFVAPKQRGHETPEQELAEIYATNPASSEADGQPGSDENVRNLNNGHRPWRAIRKDLR